MTEVASVSLRVACKLTPSIIVGEVSTRTAIHQSPRQEVGEVSMRVLMKEEPSPQDVAAQSLRNLLRLSPDFRWIDMFSDLVFPHDISEGSDAATKFSTIVNSVASGHDQRMARWDHPLMEYDVGYGVRTMEQLHDLIRFFRVMRGKLMAFRYLDKVDWTSSFAIYEEAREAEEITPFDQNIGTGDDITREFQLVKHYTYDGETSRRPIYKPIPNSVIVAVNGVPITNFAVDYSTGKVTITPKVSQEVLAVTLTPTGGNGWKLTRAPDTSDPADPLRNRLPIFPPGTWFKTTGFGGSDIIKGSVFGSTATELTFIQQTALTAEVGPVTITIQSLNQPRMAQAVTAGFHFHVPVRFDTDRLPVKLEYYGIGSASEIKLVEIRPDEE